MGKLLRFVKRKNASITLQVPPRFVSCVFISITHSLLCVGVHFRLVGSSPRAAGQTRDSADNGLLQAQQAQESAVQTDRLSHYQTCTRCVDLFSYDVLMCALESPRSAAVAR